MTAFKPFPELHVGKIGDVERILDARGNDILREPGGAERLVECWNALRKIAFPAAHLSASEDHTKRVEQLRKEAWARAETLQAELDRLAANDAPGAATPNPAAPGAPCREVAA